MRTAAISEVKDRLRFFLRAVSNGETVTIIDRGRPVALLMPLEDQQDQLRDLAAEGLARPPIDSLPDDFFRRPLPSADGSVLETIVDDREDRF